MNQLFFGQVLIDQPGWLVIHADQDGQPGEVIGYSALSEGLNRGVTVEVDPSAANTTVWAMLHYDTGAEGEYEFGEVEGADGPVTMDGSPVMSSLQVGAPASDEMMEGEDTGGEMMEDEDNGDEMMQETAVDVSLVEWAIEMPTSVTAGSVTFNVTNNGSAEHNFAIEGNGVEQALDSNLASGEAGSMTVDLEPGTYRVYCPVGNHAEQGMELELTVEG
jgi:uncharacterized cupredoxin-like copper-binding protein